MKHTLEPRRMFFDGGRREQRFDGGQRLERRCFARREQFACARHLVPTDVADLRLDNNVGVPPFMM